MWSVNGSDLATTGSRSSAKSATRGVDEVVGPFNEACDDQSQLHSALNRWYETDDKVFRPLNVYHSTWRLSCSYKII